MKNSRWYDKHKKLAPLLESFKEMPEKRKTTLVGGVMDIVKKSDTKLVEKNVLEFPLESNRRRWYDKDPYLWLLFNGLQYAEVNLLGEITKYLMKNITLKE